MDCSRCHHEPARLGYKMCRPCQSRARQHQRNRIEQGRCCSCGNAAQDDQTKCRECQEKAKVIAREFDADQHAAGRCSKCGVKLTSTEHIWLCPTCMVRVAAYARHRYWLGKTGTS